MNTTFSFRPLLLALGCVATLTQAADPVTDHAASNVAYVSNQNGNITVIDLKTFTAGAEIDLGKATPRGIGITADGKTLVVASRDSGDVLLVDLATRKIANRVPVGKNPEFVRVRGNQAFVSFEPAADGGPPPKPGSKEAQELKKQREDDKEEPARIAIVDLKTGKKTAEIIGGMETEGIEFSADGKKIIITNEADENLSVHDIASGKLLKKIDTKPYGHRPRGIKMAPDGKSYIATIEHGNKFVVLDAEFNVVKAVPTGDTPYGVAFDRSGSRLFIALAKGKSLQVFDPATYQPVAEWPTGDRCWHFTFTPDEKHILAACGRSNEVVVVDATSGKIVTRIGDKKLPWGIVTFPKSFGSLDTP
jgi:YVTN family beta-propeller protein